MQRRHFIYASALGATGIAAIAGWRFLNARVESAIAKVLHKQLHYLVLDPVGVEQFARDFAERKIISSMKLRDIDAAGVLYTHLGLTAHNKLLDAIHRGEDRIVTAYLISTDFFSNGADETRPVKYMGYFDPLRACGNPFARPVVIAPT